MDNDILRDYECGLETNIPWKIPHYGEHNIITNKRNKDSLIWNAEYRTNNYNHTIIRRPNVNVNANTNANANASIMGSYVIKKKNRRKSINNLHYPYIKFVNYILENNGNNINNNNKPHNNHTNGKGNHYNNDSIICNENDANLDFNKMLKSNQNFTMNTKEIKNSLFISTKDESGYIWQNQPTKMYKLDNIKKYKRDQSSIAYYDFNTDNSDNCTNNNNNNSNRTMANNNLLFPILYDRYEYRENGKDKNNTVDSEQEETGLDLEQLLSCDTVDSLLSPDSSYNYKYNNYSYSSNGDLSYMSNLLLPIKDNNNLNNNSNNSNNNNLYDNNNNNNNDNNLLESNNYRNINIINKEISAAVDITDLLRDTEYF